MAQDFLIALGSNLSFAENDPTDTIQAAINAMPAKGMTPIRVSRFFKTPCFPAGSGPDFVNACAVVRSSSALTSHDILDQLHKIEAEFDRKRATRWGARTLDLDLLGVEQSTPSPVLPDLETWQHWRDLPLDQQMARSPDQMILPHPRLQDRAFVLVPLCDVAAEWRHPVLGQSVAEMCAALPAAARQEVVPI